MPTIGWVAIVVVAVALLLMTLIARSRRPNDAVDSFRRQIDALSPEARRPVVDQVQHVAERSDRVRRVEANTHKADPQDEVEADAEVDDESGAIGDTSGDPPTTSDAGVEAAEADDTMDKD